jgi:hypothetical protein
MMKVDYSFTYSNRTASITLNKDIDIYGMPDSIMMEAAGKWLQGFVLFYS